MTAPPQAQEKAPDGFRLFLFALAFSALVTVVQFLLCLIQDKCPLGGDFDIFYRASGQIAQGQAAAAYDTEEARQWLAGAADGTIHVRPYLNPPPASLLIYPLHFFSRNGALAVWYGAQLLLLFAALKTDYARQWLVQDRFAALAVLFPFAFYSFIAGQNGILCAALFLLVLALREKHAIASGVMLALLCFKPQMAIVLPLLLLREKNWKAIFAAAIAGMALTGVTVALWGIVPWQRYADMLGIYRGLLALGLSTSTVPSANPYFAFHMLGAGNSLASCLQILLSFAAVILLWRGLGKTKNEAIKLALLATATFIISPYSFIYDTVVLAFACLALRSFWANGPALRIAVILLAYIPIVGLKVQYLNIPYSAFAIACGFAVASRLGKSDDRALPVS